MAAELYEPGRPERLSNALDRATPVLAVLVLLIAVVVGSCAEQDSAGDAATGVRRVGATVLETSGPAFADDNAVVPPPVNARAVWLSPDGSARVGTVPVHHRVAAGQVVSVWIDDRGSVVPAPPVGSGPVLLALLWAGVGAVVLAAGRVSTRLLAARARSRAWAREWADVEPGLSGRRE